MNKEKIKFIILLSLQIIIGSVFVISAISKLLSIEKLEFIIVENTHFPWIISVLVSRLIVSFELFTGIALIFLPGSSLIRKIAFITLCIFSVYLFVIYITKGNENDCGCFGELIKLNTLQSILKNVILLSLNFALIYFRRYEGIFIRSKRLIVTGIIFISLLIVFYQAPLYFSEQKSSQGVVVNWDLLYHHPVNQKPEIDLRKGKHIVAFLSTSCNHCKKASYKLGLLHIKYPEVSLYYIINGYDDEIDSFLKSTRSETVRHCKFLGPEDYRSLGGKTLPSVLWVENGTVIYKKNIYEISDSDFDTWLN